MTMFKDADGNKAAIAMYTWNGEAKSQLLEGDFFEVGNLKTDPTETEVVYLVPDLEYITDKALDWQSATGEFAEDAIAPYEIRIADICRL